MSPRASLVEPETTRTAIADAVLRVVARSGVAGVSMRVVAAEAKVSLGLMQRTVGIKDELLVLAADRVVERADAAVAAAGLDESLPARAFLAGLIDLLLTDDPEGAVVTAFVAHALTAIDTALPDVLARHERDGLDAITLLLHSAAAGGDLAADADPERDALGLLALVDGLGTQILLGTCTLIDARTSAHAFLERLFRG